MVNQTEFSATPQLNAIHASVVLVSPTPIDPQSTKPETLKSAGIVPENWAVANSFNLPVFLRTEFSNGFVLQAEGERYIFQEPLGGSLKDTYDVHSIAARYVEATKLTPYKAVGINWQLRIGDINSEEWFAKRSIRCGDMLQGFSVGSLQIRKSLEFSVCNITFTPNDNIIIVDCNYHFETGGLSYSEIYSLLTDSGKCQSHLENEVSSII